jgi:hypothetical protein
VSAAAELYPDGDKHTCGSGDNVAAVSSPSLTKSSPDEEQGVNDDLIGTVIDGRFDILERLTAGGMGVVYRARHVLLDAEVAIKVLLKPQDQDAQYRFLQEAQLASKVKHPNTVVVSDFGVLPDGALVSGDGVSARSDAEQGHQPRSRSSRCGCARSRCRLPGDCKPSTTRASSTGI